MQLGSFRNPNFQSNFPSPTVNALQCTTRRKISRWNFFNFHVSMDFSRWNFRIFLRNFHRLRTVTSNGEHAWCIDRAIRWQWRQCAKCPRRRKFKKRSCAMNGSFDVVAGKHHLRSIWKIFRDVGSHNKTNWLHEVFKLINHHLKENNLTMGKAWSLDPRINKIRSNKIAIWFGSQVPTSLFRRFSGLLRLT